MASLPTQPQQEFAPLPLRARGILETLDLAIKVYKQYFWVLLAWSALVIVAGALAGLVPFANFVTFLFTPLIVGPVVCALTAAVRGQNITWKQCWAFTKPRYGPMLGMYVLSFLVIMGILIGFMLIGGLVFAAFAFAIAGSGASTGMQIIIAVLLAVAFFVFLCIGSGMTVWVSLVQIVVCMEEDKGDAKSLRRAYELLRGNWVKASSLVAILMLGMLLLLGIFWGFGAAFAGVSALREAALGEASDGALWTLLVALGGATVAIWIIWNPIFYITLGLLYLDLRVRKEALDLEWTAHTTAEHIAPAPAAAPVYNAPFVLPQSNVPAQPGVQAKNADLAEGESAFPTISLDPPSPREIPTAAQPPSIQPPSFDTPVFEPASVQPAPSPFPPPVEAETNATITCAQCGASAPAGQTFCMTCGAKLRPAGS
ncbi:MAG TPA: zinc ribbon domain-containing protein [Abditibacteriaceae bacterium]